MNLKIEMHYVKSPARRYWAEVWNTKSRLGSTCCYVEKELARLAGENLLKKIEKKLERERLEKQEKTLVKPKQNIATRYKPPLDFDNRCYRISPKTGKRTAI